MILHAGTQWIRPAFGGLARPPGIGLRPTIRFQRGVPDWLAGGRDVSLIQVTFDESDWTAIVAMRFSNESFAQEDTIRKYLELGELFELLSGARVLAVGKLTRIES